MELHEVKIGDTVSFTHKGKKVTGRVIHRHDGNKNSALAGHVNIQPSNADSNPHTIHVSKLKPATQIKEDIQMADINEQILDLIDNIEAGNHLEANNIFNELLQSKIDALLDAKKNEVSSSMFNTEECAECMEEEKKMKKEKKEDEDDDEEDDYEDEDERMDEALIGGQKKIDVNKNGKLDAMDFKMLRAKKKGVKEEVEQIDELSPATLKSYDNKATKDLETHDNIMKRKPGFEKMAAKRHKGIQAARAKMKGVKEEVESTSEAYSDPYAAKKAAEMKKSYSKTMADAKKEYEAAKKPKFAKNFMKMKNEEVKPIDELKSATLGSYIKKAADSYAGEAQSGTYQKVDKRERGIANATNKLVKRAKANEEVESIDEISSETLKSYQRKSMDQGTRVLKKQEAPLSAKKFAKRVKGMARSSQILDKREPPKKLYRGDNKGGYPKQWDESTKFTVEKD